MPCRALEKTGVGADEVNYVNAHATSTPAGDMAEYRAIKKSFPGKHVRMNATKSMTGHLLGGAGAIEAIVCVEAIRTGAKNAIILCNDYFAQMVDTSRISGQTQTMQFQ